MLLREFGVIDKNFSIFTARVKVVSPNYSQWIEVKISAKNTQEAQRLLKAQYGPNTMVAALRRM
jgi:hypothetical protein